MNNSKGKEMIISAFRKSYSFHDVNWKNYDFLKEENLMCIFDDMDSDFRGNIVKIHRINNSYLIVETFRKKESEHGLLYS